MDSATRTRSRASSESHREDGGSRASRSRVDRALQPQEPTPSEARETAGEALVSIPRYLETSLSRVEDSSVEPPMSLDSSLTQQVTAVGMSEAAPSRPAMSSLADEAAATTDTSTAGESSSAADSRTAMSETAAEPVAGESASGGTAEAPAEAEEMASTETGAAADAAAETEGSAPEGGVSAASGEDTASDTAGSATTRSETAIHHGSQESKPQLAQPIIARTGNIRAPRVPSPPKEALKRSAEIRTRTGSPPEMHHAKVEQAVLRVVEVARTSQRQIVWRVEILAKDTRLSIDQMANEILGFVAYCVGQIRAAIGEAKTQIDEVTDAELDHIFNTGSLTGEALEQSRTENQQAVHDQLFAQSEALNQAHTEIQQEFDPYLTEAQLNTMDISQDGSVTYVTPPAGGTGSASTGGGASGGHSSGASGGVCTAPTGPTQNLADLDTETQSALLTLHDRDRLGAFYSTRQTPVYERQSTRTQSQLDQTAIRQAECLESFRGQFTNYALRLVTPVARDTETDQRGDEEALSCAMLDERHSLGEACGETGRQLLEKYDGVMRYLDTQLGPRLIDGLNEAGGKAVKSFRDQGEATERLMQNTAAGFADAYPQLVDRLKEMLPENQFLNIAEYEPRLFKAMESARQLPEQQYAAMNEQAEQTLKQMREAQKKQMQGLSDSTQKSLQTVGDVVIATRFDMTSFGFQVTGVMREGGWAAIEGAADYALRMATDLLKTKGEADGALNDLIRSFVDSLNGAMDSFAGTYYQQVADFKDSVVAEPTGVFATIRNEINGDLSRRSQQLNAQLTKPDTGTAIGLGLLSVATLGLATPIAAGYMIYMDADDDEIFATLGNLQWPGQPALAQYFNEEGHYGDLEQRISDCLSEDAASRALALFSADAGVRAEGRLAAVQDSFSLFGLDSDARQSLLQGFGAEERGAADPTTVQAVSDNIRDSWFSSATDVRLNQAYLRGDYGAALSARMEASLNQARARGDDNIFQSVQNIETLARNELALTGSTAFIEPSQIQTLTDAAMRDFASHRPGERRAAAEIDLSEARQTFVTAATADRMEVVGDTAVMVPVDQMVRDYVTEVVNGGWESENALAARQAYEFRHAGNGVLGPSQSDQVRFTRAFEDPRLARLERELREHPERRDEIMPQLTRARTEHDARMRRVLLRLHPELTEDEIAAAGGPTAMMAQQSAALFAGNSFPGIRSASDQAEDAQYASELISGGRASLAAGVRVATRGTGTNEELLSMTYAGRSKAEIAEARTIWQDRYGEDLDVMLGIKPRPFSLGETAVTLLSPGLGMFLYGGETSGDLAMELERAARGEPETDQDYIELAALTYAQQRQRGTGLLGSLTMSGSAEAEAMDDRRREMASTLLAEAQRRQALQARDPNASTLADAPLPDDPNAVFLPDGRIHPSIAALVFAPGPGSGGRPGADRFLGDRSLILGLSQSLELAGTRYKAELDRQESLMLSFVAVLAVIATVVLMAFGVGFVLAGVLSALGAGLLTMGIKSGMRGERYGWEEAAQDMAQTAIECAAAGVGGALGGGLGKANAFARVGQALIGRFGPVGGVIVREAIVGAVSSAAQVAIQDETYRDGPSSALGRILLGGVKGAAVSAVSAGVSESLGGGLNRRLSSGLTQGETGLLARLGQGSGPIGRAMIKEGISEAVGSMAGEAVGIYIDVMSNQFHGGLGEALKRLGQAGLRDLVTASARGGFTAQRRATFNRLMADARTATHLSDADFQALKAAAKAAGDEVSVDDIRNRIQADRAALAQLPPEIRQHAGSLDSDSLHKLVGLLQEGGLRAGADAEVRDAFLDKLAEQNPQLDPRRLISELHQTLARQPADEAAQRAAAEQQQQVRSQLTAELPEPVRNALQDIPVTGLDQIPATHLADAARLIASGRFDPQQADALLHAARSQNPQLDAVAFLKNLHSAVQSAQLAQAAQTRILARQRANVLRDVPGEAHPLFARLPDDAIGQLRSLLDQGQAGSAEQQAALLQHARAIDPTLDAQQFKHLLEQAAGNAVARQTHERMAQRAAREQRMSNIPEAVRSTLSVLPDSALVELHLRQLEGALSPAERGALEQAALRENRALDRIAFHKALDAAIEQGTPIRPSAAEQQRMQRELLAAVPEAQRHQVQDTPILIMADADFEAYTRSARGNAVTLMLNGRAVVILREGASPHALREEGIHVLQSQDPRWAAHFGALQETHLRHWDDLPLEQQMALYRNKLELEIDAQDRMIDGLGDQLRRAGDADEMARLRAQLELAQATQRNLTNRLSEVDSISPMQRHLIDAGLLARPQWLDQPARLFQKDQAPPRTLAELLQRFTEDLTERTRKDYERGMRKLDIDALRRLDALALTPEESRRILNSSKDPDVVHKLIADLAGLHSRLPEEHANALMTALLKIQNFTDLVPDLLRMANDVGEPDIVHGLLSSIMNLGQHYAQAIQRMQDFIARTAGDTDQLRDLSNLFSLIAAGGQIKVLGLLGDLRTTMTHMNLSEADAQLFIARLVNLAASGIVKQHVDLLNRAQSLLNALAKLPDGPDKQLVVEHIVNTLINGAKPRDHALDIRAASRDLADDGSLSDSTLQRFAENIRNKQPMSGGDAFRLRVEEAEQNWKIFEADPQNKYFVDLLKQVSGMEIDTPSGKRRVADLTAQDKALLAEIEPWFRHLTDPQQADPTHTDPRRRQPLTESQQLALLARLLVIGMRGAEHLDSADVVRHLESEIREEVVGVRAEPDFIAETRKAMIEMKFRADLIARLGEDFDTRLRLDREQHLTTPEVHLEELVRQRIEYQQQIAVAKAIAAQRYPDLPAGSDTVQQKQRQRERNAFFNELTAGLQQKITETTGEIIATRALMEHAQFGNHVILRGFEPGTGFDQVWVRIGKNGEIEHILIVEAKGPGAKLGTPAKGAQMSPEWVVRTVQEMLSRNQKLLDRIVKHNAADARRSADSGERRGPLLGAEAEHLHQAFVHDVLLRGLLGQIPVSGIVVHSNKDGTDYSIKEAPGADKSTYHYDTTQLRNQLRLHFEHHEIQSILQAGQAAGLRDDQTLAILMQQMQSSGTGLSVADAIDLIQRVGRL